MSNQDDTPLELDDNFDDYDFDQEFDDDLYDEPLDDANIPMDDEGGPESFDVETLDSGVEEYSDDIESFDDQDFAGDLADDEEWKDIAEEPRSRKKSFLSFNTIVIGGAFLLGAFVLYMQMNKASNDASTSDRFTSALNMQGATDGPIFGEGEQSTEQENEASANLESDGQEGGFLFEPEVLDSMEIDLGETPPQPSPIANIEDEVINIEDQVDQMMAEVEQVEQPRAPQDIEVIDIIEESAPEVVEPVTALEETAVILDEAPMIEPVIEVKAPDLEIQQNEEPLERGEPVEAEAVAEVEMSAPEPEPVMDVKPTADLLVVTDKLDMIVARLDNIEGRIDQVQGANEAAIKTIQRDIKNIKSAPARTVFKPKVTQAPKPASAQVAKPQVTPKSWELRAAQPGKAWVSERGASSMITVQAGDNLDNIGRITAISYNNGRWVVIGTKGRISQ